LALAVLVVLIGGGVVGVWVARSGSHTEPRRTTRVLPIENVYQGTSFTSNVDFADKVVTYSFALENYNNFGIYVRHVGADLQGVALQKTTAWSTPRLDNPEGSLSETITFKILNCSEIPRGQVDATLQVRSISGPWQTLKLPLMGDGAQQWQTGLFLGICPASSG